jgi:uncharacterized membrane protein
MKPILKKGQFIETILVAKLEKETHKPGELFVKGPNKYSLNIIISQILMGVALYNNEKNKLVDWDEYLTQYFLEYKVLTNIPFLSGFSGSHFWLHDETHERVLIVYLQKVIIDSNLD